MLRIKFLQPHDILALLLGHARNVEAGHVRVLRAVVAPMQNPCASVHLRASRTAVAVASEPFFNG
jgi:hypothetical protein